MSLNDENNKKTFINKVYNKFFTLFKRRVTMMSSYFYTICGICNNKSKYIIIVSYYDFEEYKISFIIRCETCKENTDLSIIKKFEFCDDRIFSFLDKLNKNYKLLK